MPVVFVVLTSRTKCAQQLYGSLHLYRKFENHSAAASLDRKQGKEFVQATMYGFGGYRLELTGTIICLLTFFISSLIQFQHHLLHLYCHAFRASSSRSLISESLIYFYGCT